MANSACSPRLRYSFVYENGTSEGIDLIVYGAGSEHKAVFERLEKESTIQDWSATSPQFENDRARNVIIADPQNPLEYTRYIYTLKLENPNPQKPIKAIRLASDPSRETSIFVIAVTVQTAK